MQRYSQLPNCGGIEVDVLSYVQHGANIVASVRNKTRIKFVVVGDLCLVASMIHCYVEWG